MYKADGVDRIEGLPAKRGMYDPIHEKDACGTGFIVDIAGEDNYHILRRSRAHQAWCKTFDAARSAFERAPTVPYLDVAGTKTHSTVQQALEALTHLDHRGATSADALTGDGVGVLTQIPHLFFRKKLEAHGIPLARDEDMAVGVFFLPGACVVFPE